MSELTYILEIKDSSNKDNELILISNIFFAIVVRSKKTLHCLPRVERYIIILYVIKKIVTFANRSV